MKSSLFAALFAAVGCLAVSLSAECAAKKSVEAFKNNERIVFYGDSITHGGQFHAHALRAQALRYPASKVYVYNGGISGGTSGGGFARLQHDILGKKPDRVFIMFGMNDVGINLYGGKEDAKTLKNRAARLASYEKNMVKNIEALLKAGKKVVLITPTPYDEYTVRFKARKYVGANEKGLAECAKIVHKLAAKYKLSVVEFHAPQTAIIKKGQGIFGRPDRVHPNTVGHYVMGAMLLEAMGQKPIVMESSVDAKSGKFTAKNVLISKVKTLPDGVSFTYEAKALPFTSDKYMIQAQAIYPVAQAFNHEKLSVKGLAPGNYRVMCGRYSVGTFTEKQLAAGLDMASLRTPAYIAAAKVTSLGNQIYGAQSVLRGIEMMRNIAKRTVNAQKFASMQEEFAALDKFGARPSIKKSVYYQNMIKSFKKNRPQEESFKKRVDTLFPKLYEEASKKVPFVVSIRKAPASKAKKAAK